MTLASDPRVQIMSEICVPLYLFDTDNVAIVWANDSALAYWEAESAEQLLKQDVQRYLTASAWLRLSEIKRNCFDNEHSVIEQWTICPGKTPKSADYKLTPFHSIGGQRLLLMQVLNPEKPSEDHSAYRATALTHTSAMISAYDKKLDLTYCNAAARASMPETMASARHRLVEETDLNNITQILKSNTHCEVNAQVHTRHGVRWHALHVKRCVDPVSAKTMHLLTETDITEHRGMQDEAFKMAYTDSLTSLPNRGALNNYLNNILESEEPQPFAVLFLDLDRFKIINDSLGHNAGDQLLIHVAQRLQQAVGSAGLVYRIGGDEFVALATQTSDSEELKHIAESILQRMAPPINISGHKIRAIPSIGICTYPADGQQASELLENADTAMYQAKAGQSGFLFYDAKMSLTISKNIKDRMELESDMVAALENNEFELYYQPKVRCHSLEVIGVEALLRWHHPTRGMVQPDTFIAIAEDTGQIIDIGKWVLNAAMSQQRLWEQQGLEIAVSVNISPRQFRANDLLSDVSEAFLETGCEPHMIELEITESMLLGEPDVVNEILLKLSSLGVRLALDDFGTGFANLDSLQRYPLDCLKIDRVFLSDRKHSMLMSTILKMGKTLGMEIVAEGVETISQINWLGANGCDVMQGYYFSEALPVKQITQYLLDNAVPHDDISNAA